jgi:hypothetical protein
MAPHPRTVSFGGTFLQPTFVQSSILTRSTPCTVPTVIPIVNDIRVLPSPTTAFIDDDTPLPTTTASTTNSTTNSPVDSTSDSSVFFLDLSGRPSLPPSEADDSDDKADKDDAEADGPPNLLPSQADDDDDEADEVAQPCPPPQRAAVMHNVALGKFFCVPTNST